MTDKHKAFAPVVAAMQKTGVELIAAVEELRTNDRLDMEVVKIDELSRFDGTCPKCRRTATLFCVQLADGSWTKRCKPCSGQAVAML